MNLHEVATCLLEEFDARRPSAIFGRSDLNLSIDDAYDVQFKVAAMRQSRGERVAGYKIGCISDTMQRQLGIDHPVFGHVWDSEIHRSGAHLRPQDFDGLAIEGELAIRLQDDVPSSAWLRNNPEVVARHLAVIELHNYVFRGAESNRAAELVTNNAIHAGVVIADEEAASNNFNPNSILQVDRNAERLGEGVAPHLQNGPVDIVAAVSEHLERRGLHLMRDQIILTGSPLPLWRVAPGDRITVRCDGLADVSCTIRGVALTNCSTGAAVGRVFCVSEVADHRPVTGLMNTILTALIAYTFYPTKPEMRGVVLQGALVPITP